MIRKYIDVYGINRVLIKIGPGFIVRPYRHSDIISTSTKWKTEDGSIIQIPTISWEIHGIEYIDE